jgi:16S rRNA processing protein RimM
VPRRVLIGHITGAHGIRGEVIVRTYTEAADGIAAYGPLSDDSGTRTFEITRTRPTPKGLVAEIKGVADRNAAEALKGVGLHVPRDRLPKPAEGEYYHADLVGLEATAPDGTALGEVVGVANFGAGDLLEIRLAGIRQTEFVPFDDDCVPVVDVAGGRCVVVMPVMVGEPEPKDPTEESGG